ncbi:MAG: SPOR domain-containing protein, partial [Pseudomonadota bacterium]
MADVELDDFDRAAERPGVAAVLANWAGALMSVGLVVGLSVWGYQMTSRDVAGVPVIRALEGPMRVQPENPGGKQVAHQGLTVNRVQAEGTAEPPANRIILAPRPIDL